MIRLFLLCHLIFFIACNSSDKNRIKLSESFNSDEIEFERVYLTFIPPFKPSRMPEKYGITQFYGKIYHIDEKEVHFIIDLYNDSIIFYIDQNIDRTITNNEKYSLKNKFDVKIYPDSISEVTVKFNTKIFKNSHFSNPFIEYAIMNKKSAEITLDDTKYRLILVDLKNNGYQDIEKDKILLENEVQLRTLDINKNFESYLKNRKKIFEFKISEDLQYIDINEKLN